MSIQTHGSVEDEVRGKDDRELDDHRSRDKLRLDSIRDEERYQKTGYAVEDV